MAQPAEVIFLPVTGKWQRRVVLTPQEAGHPCTIRQIRIRCGMQPHQDRSGSLMRNILKALKERGLIEAHERGRYTLREEDEFHA